MSLAFSPSRKSRGFVMLVLAIVAAIFATSFVVMSSVSAFANEEPPVLESPIAEVEVAPLTEPDPDPEVIPDPVPEESKKVFVCKYVGTPDVDEVLQTGDNPISVSVNAIEQNGWDGTIPGFFSDAQGRSLVIAYDTGQDPEPTCPGQDVEVTPPAPVWTDPCGPLNGYWTYTDTEAYAYSVEEMREDGLSVVIAFANDGFFFPEDAPFTWDETDSAKACPPILARTGTDEGVTATLPGVGLGLFAAGIASLAWTIVRRRRLA